MKRRPFRLPLLASAMMLVAVDTQGAAWQTHAIGTGAVAGHATFVGDDTAVIANAQGKWIESNRDALWFVYIPMTGNGEFSARISGDYYGTGALAGLMIRETRDDYSNFVMVTASDYWNSLSHQYERSVIAFYRQAILQNATGSSSYYRWYDVNESWIKIKRQGTSFTCYASPNGVDWRTSRTVTVSMAETVYIGFAVCSSYQPNTVIFRDYSLLTAPTIIQEPPDLTLYEGAPLQLSLVVEGTVPLSYLWYKDSVMVGTTSQPLLDLGAASANHSGKYYCTVRNAAGSATSRIATVNVFAAQPTSLVLLMCAALEITGTVGAGYTIDYTTDVSQSTGWTALTNIVLPSSPYFWIDVTSRNQARRFYRARTP